MSMTLQQANQLQQLIAETHPLLDISIKKVGQEYSDEWVCFVDATQYYLWDLSGWLEYRDANMKRLEIFTEEGKAQAQAKWRQSRKATKEGQAELIA